MRLVDADEVIMLIKYYGKKAVSDGRKSLDPVDDIVTLILAVEMMPTVAAASGHMPTADKSELIEALRRLSVETGSLACLGCGHEHGCSVHGCALIKAAIKELNGTVKSE